MKARLTRVSPISRTVLAVVTFSAIWGYNWVVMKQALAYSGPLDFAAMRTLFGALSLFAVMLALRRPLRPPPLGATAVLGLLQTALFTGCTMAALVWGGAGKTAVLTYTMPFWALLLSRWFLGERVRRAQWPAVALAFAGLALIIGRPPELFAHRESMAAILAILSGLAWAGSAVHAKRMRSGVAIDLLSLTAWQMLLGALLLVAVALVVPSREVDWSPYFIAALLYNVIPGTALCWLLWLFVLNRVSAGMASLATLAIPVIGVLSARIELGERPSVSETVGMVLIGTGLIALPVAGMSVRRRT